LILAAVREEGDSAGARHLAAQLPAPAYLLVGEPSGSDRLVIGYRGHLRCVVSLACEVRHGSRPEPTAAEMGCALWARVRRAVDGWSDARTGFEALTVHLLGIQTSGDGLRDSVSLRLGFRLPPSVEPEAVLATLSGLDPELEIGVESCEGAATVSRTGPLPTAMARAIRAEGREPVWQRRLGTSDLNVVLPAWGSPAIVYGPGDSELDHTPRESISLDDYGRAIRVLAQVIGEL
ncbi:MAG: M20/M25/M40 family metallo-hydrolase, partial [Candidatus Dormiibacterota bacterium]